jgi:hypothetical protein
MDIRRVVIASIFTMVLAPAGEVHANLIYTVNLDTSPLTSVAGDYALAFQLNDGEGVGDANNTITLSNFSFGGGGAAGCPLNCLITGGASGDMGSAVTLIDNSFFNSFSERFTPGASLSFKLDLTTNLDAGGVADFFGFSILHNGNALPTLDDLLADNLLYINIDAANPAPSFFATAAGSPATLGAPTAVLAPPSGEVPEPGSLVLMAIGLVSLIGMSRGDARRQSRRLPSSL